MTRALRFFRPGINLGLLVIACALVVTLAIDYVSAKHAQHRAAEKLCAAKVEAIRARNAFARRYVCPASPCDCLALVSR